MAMTLEELTKSLKYGSYAPKTEAEIQRQAQAKYEEELAQSTLAAQQAYERTAQAIESRQGQLGAAYDRQSAAAREQTARTYSAADRQALSRGMQRSSYNNQTLANINLRGDETQDRIAQARREEEAALAGEKSLAAQQLAQQIAQYQKANQSQVSAYGEQLREQEYQRRMEQDKYYNQLQAMLYEYGSQEAKTSGGRGGGKQTTQDGQNPTPDTLDALRRMLDRQAVIDKWAAYDAQRPVRPVNAANKKGGSTNNRVNQAL